MSDKVVLITEQSQPINVVDKDNYILEGIFAVFGKENVNHRIYDEKEYMPHLEYLQEKIARHKLAGELDHPEKFDVSLANISHLVEKLWYDKDTRTLRGRIRILDTDPAGMNARKLVDAGFPISISSRAAGTVKDDKHVEIKRIFTYDLVADGGFGNEAELERVKESVDTDPELKAIFESASAEPQLKSLRTNMSNVKVYDVTDKYSYMLDENADWSRFDFGSEKKENTNREIIVEKQGEIEEVSEINKKNDQMANVTVEDMAKYSRYVKDQVETLESQIAELKESSGNQGFIDNDGRISKLEEKVDQLTKYLNDFVNEHNDLVKFSNDFVKEHNEIKERFEAREKHMDELVNEHNDLVRYAEAIAQENEDIKGYLNEEVKPTVESSIKYSEYVAKNVEECANYLDEEVASTVSQLEKYQDYVAENVNNIQKYQDYLAEKANEVYSYATYLGENAASKEDLENAVGYVSEGKVESGKKVNENSSLDSKIDAILENVKIARMSKLVESSKYPFVKNFNSEQLRSFNSLNEAQKEMVSKRIATNSDINEVLNEAATVSNDKKWITNMPAEYEQAWNSLDESEKAAISLQAEMYTLETPYQIKNFWQTRGLESRTANTLNESADNTKVDLGGYTTDFIEKIRKASKRYI